MTPERYSLGYGDPHMVADPEGDYVLYVALAAAEAAPLDVERLARAMSTLPPIPDEFLNHKKWVESDWLPNVRTYAEYIASEYAALRSPDTETAP